MCQHNKAGVVASSRRDKVEDIECLVPDLASGDSPLGRAEKIKMGGQRKFENES